MLLNLMMKLPSYWRLSSAKLSSTLRWDKHMRKATSGKAEWASYWLKPCDIFYVLAQAGALTKYEAELNALLRLLVWRVSEFSTIAFNMKSAWGWYISLTPSPWTTTYGLAEWTAKWTTLNYLPWKKKITKAWLFWSMDCCLRLLVFFFFFLYAAGQLFYRRIHSSRVMADTLGGK